MTGWTGKQDALVSAPRQHRIDLLRFISPELRKRPRKPLDLDVPVECVSQHERGLPQGDGRTIVDRLSENGERGRIRDDELLSEPSAAQVGTAAQNVAAILPKDVVEIFGIRIPLDRVWFAVIIVGVGILLTLWFRFTRFGLATRAAAESEKGALVSGLSPERIALINWAISAAVAGLAYYFYGGSSVPAGQPPLVRIDAANFGELRSAFNASKDAVRVIAMLSPT